MVGEYNINMWLPDGGKAYSVNACHIFSSYGVYSLAEVNT
jgi:hypothetical protein